MSATIFRGARDLVLPEEEERGLHLLNTAPQGQTSLHIPPGSGTSEKANGEGMG